MRSVHLVSLIAVWPLLASTVQVELSGLVPEYCGSKLVETSAWLHQQAPEAFWKYIDQITDSKTIEIDLESTDFHEKIVGGLIDPPTSLLRDALASRSYSSVAAIHSNLYARIPTAELPSDCSSWIQYGSNSLCKADKVKTLVERLTEGRLKAGKLADMIPEFDRYLSRDLTAFPVVVLWADPSDLASWSGLHRELARQARIGDVTYVLRFIIKQTGCKLPGDKIKMNGYGASFEVKLEDGQESVKASMEGSNNAVFSALGMSTSSLDSYKIVTSLPQDDLLDLGMQVTQMIAESYEPLTTMKSITCNMPLLVSSIAKGKKPDRKLAEKINQIQRRYHLFPQVEILAINGLMIESSGFSLQGLRSFAARYASLYAEIKGSIDAEQAEKLLRAGIVKDVPTFDTRSPAVVWLNDLEKDGRYESDPKTLRSILRYSNTGFFPLSRNLVNAVLFLDPKQSGAAKILGGLQKNWIEKGAPVRFGLVLTNSEEDSEITVLIRSFYAVLREHGQASAFAFLDKYFEEAKKGDEVDLEACYKVVPSHKESLESISDDTASRTAYNKSRELVNRLMISAREATVFFNGRPTKISEGDDFDVKIVEGYKAEIAELQQMVFRAELSDSKEDLLTELMDLRKAFRYRNTALFDRVWQEKFYDPTRLAASFTKDLFDEKRYVYPRLNSKRSKAYRPTTTSIWLIVDANRRHEIDLVHSILMFLHKTDQPSRLQILFANPIDRHLKSVMISYRELLRGNFDFDKYAAYLAKSVSLRTGSSEFMKRPGEHGRTADYETALKMREMVQAVMVASGVGPVYKDPMIFVNGRLVATVTRDDPKITPEHIETLIQRESIRLDRILLIINSNSKDSKEDLADLIVKVSSFQLGSIRALQSNFGTGQREISSFPPTVPDLPNFRTGKTQQLVHVQSIIDPLTLISQRYSSILGEVAGEPWFSSETWLNPTVKLAHMPLPNFYRLFAGNGKDKVLSFDLGREGKYALQLDVPPAWDTALDEPSQDPDNLEAATSVAGDLDAGNLTIRMKLRGLVTEAKLEATSGRDLGGLNVIARDRLTGELIEQVPLMGDINIAQFSKLAGRLYSLEIEEHASKTFSIAGEADMVIGSGRNLVYLPLAQHNQLDLKNLSSLTPVVTKKPNDTTINVFSIASGAMYERLIRIMMVSVTKRTKEKTPVKFWLIDTFVTPAFRRSISTLASHYGFTYEFIHFRWPIWLRRQVKKHRTVWAYKVLFLDQLFPSHLDRVIYVDADQVVRADLAELGRTDLKGSPWGFVPFCDSRKETDQFRFWKQGYWKGVLEGRPYHISALFLLDLNRLRASGLADRLRRDYHMLSVDPNSLANLDQDLPNHMQDDFPIHSLPQEWLWCETWCSDESKGRAKSIDLCNYPGKRESKVQQGQRIIPEWKEYDHEVDFILKQTPIREKADL